MGQKPVRYEFKIEDFTKGVKIKKSQMGTLGNRVAKFVKRAIKEDVGSTKSPVTGRQFKSLTKEYASFKSGKGKAPIPNLSLKGDMLKGLRVKWVKSRELWRVDVTAAQNDKADGHNNHSKKSPLPERKFIPSNKFKETFRPAIKTEIKGMIKKVVK